MIHKDTLSKEWILNFRNKPDLKKKDPALIEKMIYALYLLECLARQPIDFIFKGGTSLVLIMEEGNRFSVDVDISSKITRQSIEKSLTSIVENSEFESFKLDEDRSYKNATIPKAHYFLFYKSNFNNTANYILLDILFQENKYPNIQQLKIESDWLKIVDPIIAVATPTINSILGDKLTAFAPNTTGVPYFKNKELEIIKQLFDISLLIHRVDNIKEVYNSFTSIVNEEIRFRNLQINSNDVVADIFQTALLIAHREKNNGESLIKFNEIKVGLTKISSFAIKKNFRIDEAIEASAKAAWFATKLKNKDFSDLELFNETIDIASMQIQRTEYNYLNKLKKSNKAAFYYWYKCIENEIT
jgi:hypothetical protein